MNWRRVSTISVLLLVVALIATGCLGPKTGQLKGTVVYDTGEKVVGAVVKLGDATTKTGANGEFAFINMKQGTYPLVVTLDGETLNTQQVQITGKPVILPIEVVAKRGDVTGTVTWRSGAPVEGATVTMASYQATTDATGAFTLSEVLYGDYTISVSLDGQTLADSVAVTVDAPSVDVGSIAGQRLVSAGKSYEYITAPSGNYPDDGNAELTDGILAGPVYSDDRWVGLWTNTAFLMVLDLEESLLIEELRVHHLAASAGVWYPQRIEVRVSDDKVTWSAPASVDITVGHPAAPETSWFTVEAIRETGRYVEIKIIPEDGGTNVFFSEVEVYQ